MRKFAGRIVVEEYLVVQALTATTILFLLPILLENLQLQYIVKVHV